MGAPRGAGARTRVTPITLPPRAPAVKADSRSADAPYSSGTAGLTIGLLRASVGTAVGLATCR